MQLWPRESDKEGGLIGTPNPTFADDRIYNRVVS